MNRIPTSPAEIALREAALDYHRSPRHGKISVTPTKPLSNQRDLSLAYSPGVAYPCLEIQADPTLAAHYTSRGNLVGVITNGTAVLGLGDIGPLAGKPVMEGKGCLFKKFAGIDVFDIELAETDPDKLVDIIAALEPTLGGINLEDIKAPECFYVERKLSERLGIPVFHDDQHGTAIISSAALMNALEIVGKSFDTIKLTCSGAGAAAIACLDLMVGLGVKVENICVADSKGVIRHGRPDVDSGKLDPSKMRYARVTDRTTLADAVVNADVFLGCSAAGVLSGEMVATMAETPIILALANPEPEIRPELALAARPDAIVATGRSDYPNQVNNVLCFPYIFRGALDCGATRITDSMKLACVREIAALAKAETSDQVAAAYAGQDLTFGPQYIIPKPFDSRLILRIAPAVARAAEESGVATRPIADYEAYERQLTTFVYKTDMFMRPVFGLAKRDPARVVFSDGEDERILRSIPVILEEGIAKPIVVGRPAVIDARIRKAGLHIVPGQDFEVIDPENDPRFAEATELYRSIMARRGVRGAIAKSAVRGSNTLIAALVQKRGEADAVICGINGQIEHEIQQIADIVGLAPGVKSLATMNAVMLNENTIFIADTFVHHDPSAEELVEIALLAANEVKRFGVPPKVAFLSRSTFGSSNCPSADKMRRARDLFVERAPDIECDGEMGGEAALSEEIRRGYLPETTLTGSANLLIAPNIDAANILMNVLKVSSSSGITIGPILLGAAAAVQLLTPSAVVRRVVNMTALAGADLASNRFAR